MANTADTPNIHLAYSDDADINRNWEILDSTIRALGLRQIIPDNVLIQGDLEVTGNALIDGALQVNGQSSLAMLNVSQTATFTGSTNIDGPLVVPVGPITLPPGSLDGSALAPDATIVAAVTGTANTTLTNIVSAAAPIDIASVASPNELTTHYSLVLAQATARITLIADQGTTQTITLTFGMARGTPGGVVQQIRTLNYSAQRAVGIEIPITMVRLTHPPSVDASGWALQVSQSGSAALVVQVSFAQMHLLQLR